MSRLRLAAAALCAALASIGAGPPARFGYDDVYRVVALGGPQLSPDATQAVLIVRRADREHDRWTAALEVVDVARGTTRVFTSAGEPSAPAWAPAGDRIAYLAGSPRQIWLADGDGARAHPLTTARAGVEYFAWRPDGAGLAYVAREPPPAAGGDARYLDAYRVGDESALARGAEAPAHLWLVPADGGPGRDLGAAGGSVAAGDAQSTLSFNADGTALALVRTPTTDDNASNHGTVRLVDLAGGAQRRLDPARGPQRDPLFCGDGTRLAYVRSAGDPQLHPSELVVTDPRVDGARPTPVSRGVDRPVRDFGWQPGARTLYFSAPSGTHVVLFRAADGGRPQAVPLGAVSIVSGLQGAIAREGSVAFVGRTPTRPDELYVVGPGGGPRRVSAYNDGIAGMWLAGSERITYRSRTGTVADAVLTRPPGFVPGARYPLVVVLHGGPTSASSETFDALDQLLAARGWLVLEPNYRGSDNLGARYQAAVGGDKLRGPGDDVDAALAAVRARGIVDDRRLAVSGWSYGAGLTLWMIEHRHDWAAAVAGAAVTDIAADYATADDIEADRALIGGSPFAGRHAAALAQSPITYAAQVRTPLLLMTTRGDTRVSPVGTYEFYHALRDLGREVELVAYPVDGHMPGDPVRRVDLYRRWVEYIARHFAAPAAGG